MNNVRNQMKADEEEIDVFIDQLFRKYADANNGHFSTAVGSPCFEELKAALQNKPEWAATTTLKMFKHWTQEQRAFGRPESELRFGNFVRETGTVRPGTHVPYRLKKVKVNDL